VSRPGSRADHYRFCRIEGWEEVRNSRGQAVRHHITLALELADGRILRTRISRPANNTTYGPNLWSTILKDQLAVTGDEFWACVDTKQLPDRGSAGPPVPTRALPAQLVFQLLHEVGLPEEQVAHMTLEEATAVLVAHWSKPRR
jgi:hypothetical protein